MAAAVLLAATPASLARGPGYGYVGCSDSDDCAPFDPITYAVAPAIDLRPEADFPYDATMRPDGTEVWFCGATGDGVVVLDVATDEITYRLGVGDFPTSVCFTDDGLLALVASRNDDNVAIIDAATHRVTGTLTVKTGTGGDYDGPGQLALDPVSKKVYAVDWYGPNIYEIARDASAVLRSATVGQNLWGIVVDPLGRYIYATDRGTSEVVVIDPATLTVHTTIDVSDDPRGIDVTGDGGKLVVPCEDDSNVFIINTNDWSTVARPIQYLADPRDVDILDSEHKAYITGGRLENTGESYMYVLNLLNNQLIWQFLLPGANANVVAVQAQMTSVGTGIPEAGPPVSSIALSCHPNPFGPRTAVSYFLPEPRTVELAVYDVSGRKVATLESGHRGAGEHTVRWDGANSRGRPAATGIYFVRLTAGTETRSIKTALLR
jgi:YVTN family beta-propeller protein